MEEIKTVNDQQPTTATSAASEGESGRTFTQDDVNRIVSDRLAREREKNQSADHTTEREHDLETREIKLKCREFIAENKSAYPSGLLDVLDTSNFDGFKESADKLVEMFKGFNQPEQKTSGFVPIGGPGSGRAGFDALAEAFKHK